MPLTDEFRRSGNWFFKWRSFLPLLTVALFLYALKSFEYPQHSEVLDNLWEKFCLTVSLLGLAVRVYTVGHTPRDTSGRNTRLQKAAFLNTTGMYSVTRHPLYLGNFLIWAGICLFVHSLFFCLAMILLFFLYYERIIFVEEEFLKEKFGEMFVEWAQKTPLIIPNFKNWQKPALAFSLKTALKREYTAFFLITTLFTILEFVSDLFYKGKWQFEWTWVLIFFFGLFTYVVLRTLKKKRLLDVEGR